jgi:hypothetical protein
MSTNFKKKKKRNDTQFRIQYPQQNNDPHGVEHSQGVWARDVTTREVSNLRPNDEVGRRHSEVALAHKVSFCRNDEGIGDEGSLIPYTQVALVQSVYDLNSKTKGKKSKLQQHHLKDGLVPKEKKGEGKGTILCICMHRYAMKNISLTSSIFRDKLHQKRCMFCHPPVIFSDL